MGDDYFLPASVTVRPRSTVVWINQGTTVHSVRSGLWDSGPMVPGQAFWRFFDVPGEYWFTDPRYTEQGMSGYITVQGGQLVPTRTPVGGPRIGQPQPGQAPRPPGATVQTGGSPVPAASPGIEAQTPAALASPVPGTPTTGVTGAPPAAPGGPAPAGTARPATSPMPAASPGIQAQTPAALASPVPGQAAPGMPDNAAGEPMEPDALPLPESQSPPSDEGAALPLPLIGGGLFLLGVVNRHRLRRPAR
jgi:hypothetical protein